MLKDATFILKALLIKLPAIDGCDMNYSYD